MLVEAGIKDLDLVYQRSLGKTFAMDDPERVTAGMFFTRKVVTRDKNQRFMLKDRVESDDARMMMKKVGKIDVIKKIGVFLRTLITERSFRLAGIAVTKCRLTALDNAIDLSRKDIKTREINVSEAYKRINLSQSGQLDALEQPSEYLGGMIKLLNDRGQGSDSEIKQCEDYLMALKQLNEMEAARDILKIEIADNS